MLVLPPLPSSFKKCFILLIREIQNCGIQALKGRGGLRSGNKPTPRRALSPVLLLVKAAALKSSWSRSLKSGGFKCSVGWSRPACLCQGSFTLRAGLLLLPGAAEFPAEISPSWKSWWAGANPDFVREAPGAHGGSCRQGAACQRWASL